MGCRALPAYGVDIDIYFADYVGTRAGTGTLVYLGGWTFIQFGRDILPLAEIKVFACNMAFVRNRRNSVFFLCRVVWCDFGCIVESVIRLRPSRPRRGVPRRVRAHQIARFWGCFFGERYFTQPRGIRGFLV